MIQGYKLDRLFGPSATFAGYVLLAAGLITVYFTLTSIPLLLLGTFMAFSFYSSQIDIIKKCYRINLHLFGIYPIGKWINFQPGDTISTRHFKGKYTTYSRANRQNNIIRQDFRVVLIQADSAKKIHIAKFSDETEAKKLEEKLKGMLAGEDLKMKPPE
jgi:hypothetical protein